MSERTPGPAPDGEWAVGEDGVAGTPDAGGVDEANAVTGFRREAGGIAGGDEALERLVALVPPPAAPVERPDPARWAEVEAALGTPLPSDYKALLETYGSGTFDDSLWLFSPAAPPGDGNLLHERDVVLAAYAESRARFPDEYPLPPFPEPGGVLPLGRSDSGNELYWVTDGAPDDWPVALFGGRSPRHELHPGGIVAFLVALVSGELTTSLLPASLLERAAHTFTPFA